MPRGPELIEKTYASIGELARSMHNSHKRLLYGGLALVIVPSGLIFLKNHTFKETPALNSTCLVTKNSGIQEYINLNGLVNPSISVNLTSEKTGRVSKLFVKEGFSVKKGQVVALLDTKDIDAQIHNKQREITALREKSIRLERRANRIISLSRQGMAPMTEKEESEAQVFDNRASVARVESELVTLRRERSNDVIVSPFDGTVAQIFAFPGTFVSPMTSASESDQSTKSTIMQIYSHLQVVINSPEAMVFDIVNSRGITVAPTTDTRIKIPARIERVMPYVVMTRDKVNAIPIRLDIDDPRPFLPGMNVDISIVKNPISGLGVKTHSIVKRNGVNGLLACDEKLNFHEISVLGENNGTSIITRSGVVKEGFKYSTVGASAPKPAGILDFFRKDGIDKIKQNMDVNPFR